MAAGADVSERVDLKLSRAHVMLDELVERAGEWEHVDRDERLNWMIEWDMLAPADVRELEERRGT